MTIKNIKVSASIGYQKVEFSADLTPTEDLNKAYSTLKDMAIACARDMDNSVNPKPEMPAISEPTPTTPSVPASEKQYNTVQMNIDNKHYDGHHKIMAYFDAKKDIFDKFKNKQLSKKEMDILFDVIFDGKDKI